MIRIQHGFILKGFPLIKPGGEAAIVDIELD